MNTPQITTETCDINARTGGMVNHFKNYWEY